MYVATSFNRKKTNLMGTRLGTNNNLLLDEEESYNSLEKGRVEEPFIDLF